MLAFIPSESGPDVHTAGRKVQVRHQTAQRSVDQLCGHAAEEAAFFSCRSTEDPWQLPLCVHEYVARCFSMFFFVVIGELSVRFDRPFVCPGVGSDVYFYL